MKHVLHLYPTMEMVKTALLMFGEGAVINHVQQTASYSDTTVHVISEAQVRRVIGTDFDTVRVHHDVSREAELMALSRERPRVPQPSHPG